MMKFSWLQKLFPFFSLALYEEGGGGGTDDGGGGGGTDDGGGGGGTDDGGGTDAKPITVDVGALQGDTWATIQNSDAFKENAALRNTKGFEDLVTQFTNAQSLIGQDRLPMPKDDWTEEQWAAHYDRLGRPESPDKYELPESFEPLKDILDKDFLNETLADMHKQGFTPKQAQLALDRYAQWFSKASADSEAVKEAAFNEAEASLKKEFGDKYDMNVQMGENLLNEFFDADTVKWLGESGLGNNPGFIKGMFKIAETFGDDSAVGESLTRNLSPVNAAKQSIAELKADDAFRKRLFDESHPGHKEAVQKWQDLHKKAFPSK
jgi:hypothetical protein